ncbi:helix-turn-helix domain-containing protein [Oceaniglobus trochenteri]|uniref:helix-turn-helix domain-containing protein n=1 Tax=Oceaniglobus trochenteri TaxID=2763260 RepID=UPI001CFF9EBB|nr:helix-turn-helix domain-containing protein [Oceaniglobus trochenteri]
MSSHDRDKTPALDWEGIKAALHRKGMTFGELSVRSGLTRTACGKVKNATNYAAQKAIADFLGYKPESLWPSRYPKGGPRILDTKKYPPVDRKKSVGGSDRIAAQ